MTPEETIEKYKNRIRELEQQLSELKYGETDLKSKLEEEAEKRRFYQLVADFTFGWELWFDPAGSIKYCSPSCFDLTGFTANQIIASGEIAELLVYQSDRQKFAGFLEQSLNQALVNQTLEFRMLTRTKQLRWCMLNVRGVYDKQGKYLGIRASVDDVTRLKRAMGQIHEMEAAKELENRTRQRLQTELGAKDRELVSFLLQLSQKNELLSTVKNQLQLLEKGGNVKNYKVAGELIALLGKQEKSVDWSLIENELEKIHPGFINRLQAKHTVITLKDKRLCGYMRLGLTSREIAGLLNITAKSVEIARIRLRKKLKLPAGIRLTNYLNQL
ncbi:MAG: PAS domain S-box protein [Draconibacterium sp.]